MDPRQAQGPYGGMTGGGGQGFHGSVADFAAAQQRAARARAAAFAARHQFHNAAAAGGLMRRGSFGSVDGSAGGADASSGMSPGPSGNSMVNHHSTAAAVMFQQHRHAQAAMGRGSASGPMPGQFGAAGRSPFPAPGAGGNHSSSASCAGMQQLPLGMPRAYADLANAVSTHSSILDACILDLSQRRMAMAKAEAAAVAREMSDEKNSGVTAARLNHPGARPANPASAASPRGASADQYDAELAAFSLAARAGSASNALAAAVAARASSFSSETSATESMERRIVAARFAAAAERPDALGGRGEDHRRFAEERLLEEETRLRLRAAALGGGGGGGADVSASATGPGAARATGTLSPAGQSSSSKAPAEGVGPAQWWICQKCKSRAYASREEARAHEALCGSSDGASSPAASPANGGRNTGNSANNAPEANDVVKEAFSDPVPTQRDIFFQIQRDARMRTASLAAAAPDDGGGFPGVGYQYRDPATIAAAAARMAGPRDHLKSLPPGFSAFAKNRDSSASSADMFPQQQQQQKQQYQRDRLRSLTEMQRLAAFGAGGVRADTTGHVPDASGAEIEAQYMRMMQANAKAERLKALTAAANVNTAGSVSGGAGVMAGGLLGGAAAQARHGAGSAAVGKGESMKKKDQQHRRVPQSKVSASASQQGQQRRASGGVPPAAAALLAEEDKWEDFDEEIGQPLYAIFPKPVALAMSSDKDWLTPLHCFVRRHCVQVFTATPEDVATPSKGKRRPIHVGQVGIRCPHCYPVPGEKKKDKDGEDDNTREGSDNPEIQPYTARNAGDETAFLQHNPPIHLTAPERGSIYYPFTISSIYNATMNLLQRHLQSCPNVPRWIMDRYRELKSDDARSGTSKKYWIDAAAALGLVDTTRGIRVTTKRPLPPLPSVGEGLRGVGDIAVDGSRPVVVGRTGDAGIGAAPPVLDASGVPVRVVESFARRDSNDFYSNRSSALPFSADDPDRAASRQWQATQERIYADGRNSGEEVSAGGGQRLSGAGGSAIRLGPEGILERTGLLPQQQHHHQPHQPKQQHNNPEKALEAVPVGPSLVSPDDSHLATSFSYHLMAQMQLCTFTEADRLGKRKALPIGFAGLACRHCYGGYGTGRFFPSTIKTLSDTSKTLNVLYNHMLRCRKCPTDIRRSLEVLRSRHDEERSRMKFGSQKAFFARIWGRLHGGPEHPLHFSSNASAASVRSVASMQASNDPASCPTEAPAPSPSELPLLDAISHQNESQEVAVQDTPTSPAAVSSAETSGMCRGSGEGEHDEFSRAIEHGGKLSDTGSPLGSSPLDALANLAGMKRKERGSDDDDGDGDGGNDTSGMNPESSRFSPRGDCGDDDDGNRVGSGNSSGSELNQSDKLARAPLDGSADATHEVLQQQLEIQVPHDPLPKRPKLRECV